MMARSFVDSIDPLPGFWVRLITHGLGYHGWRNRQVHQPVEHYVADAFTRGELKAFRLPCINHLAKTKRRRQCIGANGKRIQFIPASEMLTNFRYVELPINTDDEAHALIESLQLSDTNFANLAEALDVPAQTGALQQALANGEIVIINDDLPRKPTAPQAYEQAPRVGYEPPPPRTEKELAAHRLAQKETVNLQLKYHYDDGSPIEDITYQVVDVNGATHKGKLQSGVANLPNLPVGQCDITYIGVDASEEQKLIKLRAEFAKELNAMIDEIANKAAIEDAIFEQSSLFEQWAIEVGARVTGLYEGGKSLVTGIGDLTLFTLEFNIEVINACYSVLNDLISGDIDAVKESLETILASTNKKYGELNDSFELLGILLGDKETRTILAKFPFEYIDAHSHVDKERFIGIAAFEILLALCTAGAGTAVSALSKSKHLVKANSALKKIAEIVKRKRLSVEKSYPLSPSNTVSEKVIDKPKHELNKPIPRNGNSKDKEKDKLYPCDWDDCKKKHKDKVTYDKKGRASKNNTYSNDWINAGLEPWKVYGASNEHSASYEVSM